MESSIIQNMKISKFWIGPKDPNRTRYETDGAISLLDPKGFQVFLKKYSWRIISLALRRRGESISTSIRLYHNFGQYLMKLTRHHGPTYTVKYLKASQLSVQKKIAGQALSSLRELEPNLPLPRLAKSGLPAIIGLRHRRAIYSGSLIIVRLWLTLFSIYRIIKIPVVPKLKTITDPFCGDLKSLSDIQSWTEYFAPGLIGNSFVRSKVCNSEKILPLEKASPSNSTSWFGLLTDAVAIGNSKIFSDLKIYCEATENWYILNKIRSINKLFTNRKHLLQCLPFKGDVIVGKDITVDQIPLGQLAFKEEAAGKLRIFAMVDIWTQSLLRPLHEALFDLLKTFPNDGTFDQEKSFSRCVEKAKLNKVAFGYDLSAATDRLPIDLQVTILSILIGRTAAEAWKGLLVGRGYVLPSSAERYGLQPGEEFRYAVGQPMGALSSWAMLALTHHLIVQYCYWCEYPTRRGSMTWFDGYEVLGDDIQIFDEKVANRYLKVCDGLGVSINLSKSVVSKQLVPVVEYAKRTSMLGSDVSALSWKMLASQDNLTGRVNIAMKVFQKGVFTSLRSAFALATASKFRISKSGESHSIISFYTNLYKQELVSWEWLLERICDRKSFEIFFGKNRLPKLSVKEFEQVELAIKEGRDLSTIPTDPDREFAVKAHYIEPTKLVLYERIDQIMRIMISDKFMTSSFQSFLKGIWHEGKGTYDPESQFVIKDLAQDMISDIYQFEMLDAFAVDLNLLHYHELAQHMDKLENMRRALELGIRSKADRKKPINSTLYVLKSLEKILSLPKEWWEEMDKRLYR